jgi:hypothetical protein
LDALANPILREGVGVVQLLLVAGYGDTDIDPNSLVVTYVERQTDRKLDLGGLDPSGKRAT